MAQTTDRWTAEGKRFMREIQELKRLTVKVGFQDGEHENNGAHIIDVAMWNELGTVNAPSRPFMRDSIDNHKETIEAFCRAQVRTILRGGTARQVLQSIGVMQKGLMQDEITEGDFEPNAPATIRRKKSDKPLIDTGRMRQSVHFIIRPKGGD